jgi:hypothetical protein
MKKSNHLYQMRLRKIYVIIFVLRHHFYTTVGKTSLYNFFRQCTRPVLLRMCKKFCGIHVCLSLEFTWKTHRALIRPHVRVRFHHVGCCSELLYCCGKIPAHMHTAGSRLPSLGCPPTPERCSRDPTPPNCIAMQQSVLTFNL